MKDLHYRIREPACGYVVGTLNRLDNLPLSRKPLEIVVNKKVQLDATVCGHLFTAKLLYMFQVSQHPSSGALKTVTATSGIGHTVKYKLKIKN